MEEEKFISGEEFKSIKNKQPIENDNKQSKKILLIVVAIIYSIIIFYSGITYQKDHQPKAAISSTTSKFGGFGGRSGASFANRLFGSVTAVSANSITVQNARTGTMTTATINNNTIITNNQQTVSASSISVGENIMIVLNPSNTRIAASITVVNFSNSNNSSSASSSQNQP
jgi:hypothetical protein